MYNTVEKAVDTIRSRYCEPLNLDEIASTALISKFHLLRTFRRTTGITPGRFLTAVRLDAAKELLRTSSINIADIAVAVGYSSTGSFTRRFTEAVGMPPTQYRCTSKDDQVMPDPATDDHTAPNEDETLLGVVQALSVQPQSAIFIGAFDGPILQGYPAASTVIAKPGPFTLTGLPAGSWYVHAVAQAVPTMLDTCSDMPLLVDRVGPVHNHGPGNRLSRDLFIRPSDWTKPPVLFALPGLEPRRPMD
jgi:AraC family transcriptional regulator